MKKFIVICLILTGCIGEDIIPDQPEVQIMNSTDELKVLELRQFDYTFSVAFEIEPEELIWSSSDETILVINEFGNASATSKAGTVTLSATATYKDLTVTDELEIEVSEYELSTRITNPIASLENGTQYQLNYVFTNELSQQVVPDVTSWSSSDEAIFEISSTGLLSGISEGTADLTLETSSGNKTVFDIITIEVSSSTTVTNETRFGSLSANSGLTLAGDFELTLNESNDLVIAFGDNFEADNTLTDLYIYLSNDPSSLADALEVAKVSVYSGANEHLVPGVSLLDYNYLVFANKSDQSIIGTGEALDEIVSLVKQGTVATTSHYVLTGNFLLEQDGNDLNLSFESNYRADTRLPGLYVYLSNNPNSIASALEIASVTTFSGAHSYTIKDAGLEDYEYVLYFCKPFNARVGHGEITN